MTTMSTGLWRWAFSLSLSSFCRDRGTTIAGLRGLSVHSREVGFSLGQGVDYPDYLGSSFLMAFGWLVWDMHAGSAPPRLFL